MGTVWVYKFDGTVQCDAEAQEIPLEQMRTELVVLIGDENVQSMKKDQRPMIQLCGMPTGRINCYEITETGWVLLSTGKIPEQEDFSVLMKVRRKTLMKSTLAALLGR